MEIPKVLWIEDQHEDFDSYNSVLFRAGYLVDYVKSVSEAERKLREDDYAAVICDIIVLPGDDPKWIELDNKKRKENPYFDSYLGLELLRSLFHSPDARVTIKPPIEINPKKIIVFSVVYDKTEVISSLGIPGEQIIYKAESNVDTLPRVIEKIKTNIK